MWTWPNHLAEYWQPPFTNAGALSVLLMDRVDRHAVVGRRIARKDAAITAAGAAAVIGTAAIAQARTKSYEHRQVP